MNVLIVEDECHAADRLKALLIQLNPDIRVLDVLESVADTVAWFKENAEPDLAFFDIHLGDGSSFDIFQRVNVACPIIFVTAYDQYAIRAFQVNSIDYLLKPIDLDDLKRALYKFGTHRRRSDSRLVNYDELVKAMSRQRNYKSRFLVNKGAALHPVGTEDVAYLYTSDGVVYLNTFDNRRFILSQKLEELEEVLDPSLFFRANRQFIVHHSSIQKIHPFFNGKLRLELHPSFEGDITVSRLKATALKEWLGDVQ